MQDEEDDWDDYVYDVSRNAFYLVQSYCRINTLREFFVEWSSKERFSRWVRRAEARLAWARFDGALSPDLLEKVGARIVCSQIHRRWERERRWSR
eukprot:SAG22_NODE_3448_length_1705_cov_10.592777_2_plen_95_part_00